MSWCRFATRWCFVVFLTPRTWQNHWKTIVCLMVLTYQRKPCSRRKALRNDAKMYPNGSQNGSKNGPKMGSEIAFKWLLIFGCFLGPNWVPKGTQNGSKFGPKNGWQNELRFLMKQATPTSTLSGPAGPVGEDLGRGKGSSLRASILELCVL